MKQNFSNSFAAKDRWRLTPIAVAFVLMALLGATSGSAQSKTQKRVTSVALGTATGGSRVTVLSDSALNDYEAYRRGDRFYVKIPAADFASGVPNLSGAGFEDVRVQKAADGSIISFRLQPGTAARVDQRSNRLDVVFSTLARSEKTSETHANVTGRAQNSNGNRADVAGSSPASSISNSPDGRDSSSSNANAIERKNQSTYAPQQSTLEPQQRSGGTPSQPDPAISSAGDNETATASPSVASSSPESLGASMSPGQPTTVQQQPTPAAQGTTSSQTLPVRGRFAGQWLAQNWLLAVVAAILIASLPLLFVVYRRARLKDSNGPVKETGAQPQKAVDVGFNEAEFPAAKTAESSEFKVEPVPLVPPSENPRTQKAVEPQLLQEVHRVKVEREILPRSEEESNPCPEVDTTFRMEAETLRRAAEEFARRRSEGETAGPAEGEALLVVGDEVSQHLAETRLPSEEEVQGKGKDDLHSQAEEGTRLRAEEEARRLADEEICRRVEEQRLLVEAEERRRIAAERLKLEQEELMQVAIELTRRRAEVEEARGAAEDEFRPLGESQEPMRVEADQDVQVPSFDIAIAPGRGEETSDAYKSFTEGADSEKADAPSRQFEGLVEGIAVPQDQGTARFGEDSSIPLEILERLNSNEARERAAGLAQLAPLGGGHDVFSFVSRGFEDESTEVRNAAAQALYDMQPDRAASFARALREGSPERRRRIGAALASSGLANNAINNLTGESRENTYDAFSLLFLMAKAGEVQPLMQAIEEHASVEVRLAVIKLLALSGQSEIVPALRRLAVRGSLPSEVRSAVMEAIYQISSQARENAHTVA